MGRNRKRYRDVASIPAAVKQKVDSDWKVRHAKRLDSAANQIRFAGIAFAKLGGWLVVHNGGHHWQIYFGRQMVVEWWPSSAKVVINKRWRNGLHCHRWQDLFRYVREERAKQSNATSPTTAEC